MSYFAFGVLSASFSLYYPNMIALPIITFIGVACVSYYLYRGSILSHLFATFLFLIIGTASEVIVAAILSNILQVSLSQIRDNDLYIVTGMLVSKMLCLLIVGVIAYFAEKRKSSNLRTMWKIIPLMLCQVVLIVFITTILVNAYQRYDVLSGLDIIKIFSILLVSIFIFTYYDVITRVYELEHMHNLAQIQLNSHIKHYNHVQEQEKLLMSIEHDIRKFVVVTGDLIDAGQTDEAITYKASLERFLDNSINLLYTPHPVVNAILNNCLRRAKSLEVAVEHDIRIPDKLEINDIDLTIILGNILDNAIYALEAIEVTVDRELIIKLVQDDYFLLFEVVNTWNSQFINKNVKKPQQGYGLKNVEICVKKYSGELNTSHDENKFKTTAIMNVSSPNIS